MYYVYVLVSERNGRFYVGQTRDIVERLRRHNAGTQVATRGYEPWHLARLEQFSTRQEACARELEIKSKKSRTWLEWLLTQPGDCRQHVGI